MWINELLLSPRDVLSTFNIKLLVQSPKKGFDEIEKPGVSFHFYRIDRSEYNVS